MAPKVAPDRDVARSGAQTVERAVEIMNLFLDGPPALTITAIARRTGLNLSTAHRLVRTLVHTHFMEQDPLTEQYRLGSALAVLGHRSLQIAGVDVAKPVLERLGEQTDETVSLGLRRGAEVLVVMQSTSRQALRFEHPSGRAISIHASAMGKALLAFGGESVTAAVEQLGELPRYTDATIASRRALVAELEQIREVGYAVNRQERYAGVCGVAAAVVDDAGVARYAVGMQGPSVRLTEDVLAARGAELVDTAAEIAALLHGRR